MRRRSPSFARAALRVVVRDADWLEEELVCEIRVFAGLYGFRKMKQLEWARATLPAEYVDVYFDSWRTGRHQMWAWITELARNLQQVTGESGPAWKERLRRIETLSDVDLFRISPTTLRRALSFAN
jgi:hypothetical protein